METTVAESTILATDNGGEPGSWSALLAAYRSDPRQQSAARLVERLGPWLTAARRRLRAVPPHLDQDDVAQQLIVEVLQIAAQWRPACEDRWIPRRLVERAERKLLKSLLKENLNQPLELDSEVESDELAEPDLVIDSPVGKASVADLRLIYRANVLGESIEVLAAEEDVTPKQMRRRLKAARARARATTPAGRAR
jgi:hypothetical protein